jgi:hypothetical protein
MAMCFASQQKAADWQLWVISLEGSRGRPSTHFRYSPKS